jgi:ABC-type multidrug transport system fused ATPase/permease subunit
MLVWITYNMLSLSLALGLLSLLVVPLMAVATVWFSTQARKAFRRTRQQMGSVNAELQENIAAVREVQAFNRAEENIESFRITNAANRDANVRAVAFTSALAPTLEALDASGDRNRSGGFILLHATWFGTTVTLGLRLRLSVMCALNANTADRRVMDEPQPPPAASACSACWRSSHPDADARPAPQLWTGVFRFRSIKKTNRS